MPSFYSFAPTLDDLFQAGFLTRQLEEGLDSDLAYRRHATEETIGGRLGSRIILPKVGRKAPVIQPLNPTNIVANLDNGLTPSLPSSETYEYNLQEWGDTEDVDLIGSTAACANLVKMASRTNGVQAAQSMERIAKIELFGSYDVGNTFCRTDLGASSTTVVYVDDIRGFQYQMVNGVQEAVSVSNPLPVVEVRTTSGGINQRFNVTGATATGTNYSLYPGSSIDNVGNVVSDGISGFLTISGAAQAPVNGDAIVATNAAIIKRPLNKPSINMLTSSDTMTLSLILAAKQQLVANNVPPMPDGTYHFIHDPFIQQQLFADQQFLTAYASRFKSQEWQEGQIFELLGVTFIPTTEAYVQPPTPDVNINVTVRRSIMLGAEALLQANYDGLDMYLNEPGSNYNPIGMCMLVSNVAQIIRPPIDRMQRLLSLTWTWIGDFTCPTDVTATQVIIPTGSSAQFKRAVVIETAG